MAHHCEITNQQHVIQTRQPAQPFSLSLYADTHTHTHTHKDIECSHSNLSLSLKVKLFTTIISLSPSDNHIFLSFTIVFSPHHLEASKGEVKVTAILGWLVSFHRAC